MPTEDEIKIRKYMLKIHQFIVINSTLQWHITSIASDGIYFNMYNLNDYNMASLEEQSEKIKLKDYYEFDTTSNGNLVYHLKSEYNNWKFKENIITQCKLIGVI